MNYGNWASCELRTARDRVRQFNEPKSLGVIREQLRTFFKTHGAIAGKLRQTRRSRERKEGWTLDQRVILEEIPNTSQKHKATTRIV